MTQQLILLRQARVASLAATLLAMRCGAKALPVLPAPIVTPVAGA